MAQWHKQMLKAKARKKSMASAGAEEMLTKKKPSAAVEQEEREGQNHDPDTHQKG